MKTIRIDGVDFDPTSDAFVQAFAKFETKLANASAEDKQVLATLQARADAAEAKADAAAGELKKAQAEAQALPAKLRADLAARAELEGKARKVLGATVKLDGVEPKAVRLAVLGKLLPDAKLEGKSDAYLEARFDAAVESFEKDDAEDGWSKDADKLDTESEPAERLDADAAEKAFLEASRNAWKKPLSMTKS